MKLNTLKYEIAVNRFSHGHFIMGGKAYELIGILEHVTANGRQYLLTVRECGKQGYRVLELDKCGDNQVTLL